MIDDRIVQRNALAWAIRLLTSAAAEAQYEPLKDKFRHAYGHLQNQVAEIDRAVLEDYEWNREER